MLFEVSSNGLFALSYVLRQLRNAALAVLLHTAESCFNALLALLTAVFIGLLLAEILFPIRCDVLYLCEALISTPTLKSGNRPYSMNIK